MRVLFDARPILDAPRGGVGRVALAQAKRLLAQPDMEIVFFTTGSHSPAFPAELLGPQAIHKHINIPNKVWSVLCILGFHPLSWFTQPPDLLFLPNIGFIGAPSTWKSQLIVHDVSFLIEPCWFRPKQRIWHHLVRPKQLFRQATELLCVSQRTLQDAVDLAGVSTEACHRLSLDPLSLTETPTVAFPKPPAGRRMILAFGADDPRKNFATAEFAVRHLKQEPGFEDLQLFAIGRDAEPTDQELIALYQQAAVLLYPSWYEGFGLPLHEAASYGCKAIASTAGALPETAPPGTRFAHPAKPHQWAMALRSALQSS